MSDFLNRLAARTLGQAPVVRPLVPTLFAPRSGYEEIRSGTEELHVQLEHAPHRETPSQDGGELTLPQPHEPSALGHQETLTIPGPDRPYLPIPEEPERPERPAGGRTDKLPPTQVVAPQPVAEETSESTAPLPEPKLVAEPKSVNSTGQISSPPRIVLAQLVAPQATRPIPALLPKEGPHKNPGDRREHRAEVEPHAPIVRVTIGRIEVRAEIAAPPSAPPAAKSVRAPTLTLDEYLKQRHEGKR